MRSISIQTVAWLGLALALSLFACGGSGPGAAVDAYQQAIHDGDYRAAYGWVSSEDRSVQSEEEFVAKTSEAMALFGGLVRQMTWKVTDERIEGDEAFVTLQVTRPAIESMMGELMSAALASAFEGKGEGEASDSDSGQQVMETLQKKMEEGDVPMTEDQETYRLVREEGGWRIAFGWQTDRWLSEARELRREDDLEGALAKLEDILATDAEHEEAAVLREEVAAELEAAAELRAYRETQVTLKDFRVERRRRYGFGDPEPVVRGTLENLGDWTLERLWITVYFLGDDGEPMAEKTYAPISEYGGDGPLRPGYVRDFGYFVGDSAPSRWDGETARAEVSRIELADSDP